MPGLDGTLGWLAGAIIASAVFANAYPFASGGHTEAFGANVILQVSLAWPALLYIRFLLGHGSFTALERWQTDYLLAYAAWVRSS
jgi:hypothetical protein